MIPYTEYKKIKIKKKKQGGNPDEPISFLENTVSYTKKYSLSNIFEHNFSKILELSLDFDSYIYVSNDHLDILNQNGEAILEYKNYENHYDEEFNPEFSTNFNEFKNSPKYKGIYSFSFNIKLPDHHDDNKIANKCFDSTLRQLTAQFRKLIKKLKGNQIFKSSAIHSIDHAVINEEEYLAFDDNHVLYILFSRNIFKYPNTPEEHVLHVGAHYLDLNAIPKDFDFHTAKHAMFDKFLVNSAQKWQLVYDKARKRIEFDAIRTKKNDKSTSNFASLDTNLTRHIFSLANKLTEYTDLQISRMIKKAALSAKTLAK